MMKNLKNKTISFTLAFLLFIFNQPFLSYATSISDSRKSTKRKVNIYQSIEAEESFYKSDYDEASFIFGALSEKKDRNCALFNNQLGSIYLAKGDYKKALDSFLEAYYLINDISAFRNLESRAVSLFGSEAKKAYKGDPYEKAFNSLYVGLLLCEEGDLENALAAFKNGILCDSDVEGNLYSSDVTLLYLLAARVEALRKNRSMSNDYFNEAVEAFYLSHPLNRKTVSEEQALVSLLTQQQKEYGEIIKKYKKPKKEKKKRTKVEKQIAALNLEIEKLDKNIKQLSKKRQENNNKIDISRLRNFIDPENNVLLCIELGRGPLKYQIGRYGEIAIFTSKPYEAKKLSVTIDSVYKTGEEEFLKNNDSFYQALTRGGRVMDGILKGQAQFKQTTAELAHSLSEASQQMTKQANQMAASNPYADTSGTQAAAALLSLFSLVMTIGSSMANPAADTRHWSLLPAELQIIPLKLNPGIHHIDINVYDEADNILSDSCLKFDINVKPDNGNIVFKRISEKL